MFFLENLLTALDSIRNNKMRSALTMLGVIIGVASVVLMVAIGQGAQQDVTNRIESMGSNLLVIQPGSPTQTDVRSLFRRNNTGGSSNSLTIDDAEALQKNVTGLSGISPEVSNTMQAIFGSQNMQTSVVGITPDYTIVNNFQIEFGRFINDDDIAERKKVLVIGQEVATTLFGTKNPIGQDIRLENHIFTIIGIMESKGQSGFTNLDDIALIPISTMQERILGSESVSAINVSVENQEDMDITSEWITTILLNEHRIKEADQDFNILNQAETVETLNEVTQTFTFLLGGIAAISLLVGGIGVMNIMLVSVTERTREIGIRKAIGAKKKDILQQFLVESTLLSLLGGIIGIIISISGAWALSAFAGVSTIISVSSIILAFTFSMFVGISFGILPAWKAAKLKPIDALRYE